MVRNDPKQFARALAEAAAARPVATWRSFGKLTAVLHEVPQLRQALIATTTFSADRRIRVVDTLLREWSEPLRRLVDLLVESRILDRIDDVYDAYTKLLRSSGHPLVRVEAPEQLPSAALLRILEALPGDRMTFLVESVVNPELIGGVRVEYEDREYDLSLGGALDRLETELEVAV